MAKVDTELKSSLQGLRFDESEHPPKCATRTAAVAKRLGVRMLG